MFSIEESYHILKSRKTSRSTRSRSTYSKYSRWIAPCRDRALWPQWEIGKAPHTVAYRANLCYSDRKAAGVDLGLEGGIPFSTLSSFDDLGNGFAVPSGADSFQ